jgi:hypothetical protein
MKPAKRKPVTMLDADELAKATAEFDREFIVDEFHPLDAAAKRRWAAAKRKRGRPTRGRGAQIISLSVERGLLRKTDALAKRLKLSRARIVELGLRRVLQEAS